MYVKVKWEAAFLVYWVIFLMRNMCVENKREFAFTIRKMYVQNKWEAAF